MNRHRLIGIALLGIGILFGDCLTSIHLPLSQAHGQPPAKSDPDLEAVKSTAVKYGKAFEANDAASLAALFTEEAEFVDGSDTVVHGRKAIQEAFATLFRDNPKHKVVVDMDVVRRISSTCLVEEGTYTFQSTSDPKASSDRSKYVIFHVKQADGWRIASVRTNRDSAVAHHEQLKSLDWLLGNWVTRRALHSSRVYALLWSGTVPTSL